MRVLFDFLLILRVGPASLSFAASNVTLYGQLDEGLVVGKAKHSSTTATLKSGFVGMSRWGIKGVEDLGNGYSVGFTLEQGFLADSGAEHTSGLAFSRESLMRITGPFGQVALGRMGALGFAQSTAIHPWMGIRHFMGCQRLERR